MAKYMVLRNGYIKDTEDESIIPPDPANSHYQIYQKWLLGQDVLGNDLGTGPNTADVEAGPTLEEAKTVKIAELKSQANQILGRTDWYVIRNTEAAVAVPSAVTSYRTSVRTYTDTAEGEINALSDVESVEGYAFTFPVQS